MPATMVWLLVGTCCCLWAAGVHPAEEEWFDQLEEVPEDKQKCLTHEECPANHCCAGELRPYVDNLPLYLKAIDKTVLDFHVVNRMCFKDAVPKSYVCNPNATECKCQVGCQCILHWESKTQYLCWEIEFEFDDGS